MQHSRLDEVADERLVAEREARSPRSAAHGRPTPCIVGRLRERLTAVPGRGELDRVEDLRVPRAAAEVPEERVRDLVARRLGVLGEVAPRTS